MRGIAGFVRIIHFALLVTCAFLYAALVALPAEHPWRTAIAAFGAGAGVASAAIVFIARPRDLKITDRYKGLLANTWFVFASTVLLCILVALLLDQVFLVREVTFIAPQEVVVSEEPAGGKALELGMVGANKPQIFWLHAGQRRLLFADFPRKHEAVPVDITVLPVWHRMPLVWITRTDVTRAVEQAALANPCQSADHSHVAVAKQTSPRYDVRILFPNLSDLPKFSLDGNQVQPGFELGIATFHLAAGRHEIVAQYPDRECQVSFDAPQESPLWGSCHLK